MTVLHIRAHKRFGVCRSIRISCQDGRVISGLLIEVSREGCRVSNLDADLLVAGDLVEVEIDESRSLLAHVRWQRDGAVGLRLAPALHNDELAGIIDACRSGAQLRAARRA